MGSSQAISIVPKKVWDWTSWIRKQPVPHAGGTTGVLCSLQAFLESIKDFLDPEPVHLQLCGLARICLTATPSGWMNFREYRSRRQIFIAQQMLGISSFLTDLQAKIISTFFFFFSNLM